MSRPLLPILGLAALVITTAACAQAQAQAQPRQGGTVLGDGHSVIVTDLGPGSRTWAEIDGADSLVRVRTTLGGQTTVFGHGAGSQIVVNNPGEVLTVMAGACQAPMQPVQRRAGSMIIITCH